MTSTRLISALRRLGIQVSAAGDQLKIRAPEGVLTADLKRALTEHRADLLRMLTPTPRRPVQSTPERSWYPLSHNQRQLWFEQQLAPESSHYNVPVVLRLGATTDVAAVESSLRWLVARHPALRARFPVRGDTPVMENPADDGTFALSIVDLADEADSALEQAAIEFLRQPFDLTRGRLVKGCILRQRDRTPVLAIALHHIVADGWSMGVLMKDFQSAYTAFASGSTPAAGAARPAYGDFALWQAAAGRQPELLETACALVREVPDLPLPHDVSRPEVPTRVGGLHVARLDSGDLARLTAVARVCGTTLFPLFTAAYAVALCLEIGSDRLALGTDVAGREDSAWDDVVGHFVNQIVVVVDLTGNPSLHEIVGRAARSIAQAHGVREVPFERLLSAARERSGRRTALFRAKIVMQPPFDGQLDSEHFEVLPVHHGTCKFDLLMNVWVAPAGSGIAVEYSRDLFSETTGARFLRRTVQVLNCMRPDDLTVRLDEIWSRLADRERQQGGTRLPSSQRGSQRSKAEAVMSSDPGRLARR